MRVSSFARLAGVGVAIGGAGYIPFASSVGTQSAGASGWGWGSGSGDGYGYGYGYGDGYGYGYGYGYGFEHVVTDDPGYYYEYKEDTVCTIILPHGHIPLYNCWYRWDGP
jgi:hypothetical protein